MLNQKDEHKKTKKMVRSSLLKFIESLQSLIKRLESRDSKISNNAMSASCIFLQLYSKFISIVMEDSTKGSQFVNIPTEVKNKEKEQIQ